MQPRNTDVEPCAWWVLYTKPRAEKRADEGLRKCHFVTYLPVLTVMKQWSDRKKKIIEPLFRSYLFVNCTQSSLSLALQEEHIVAIVKFNGQPARVREDEIALIRRIESGTSEIEVIDKQFITGQIVLIKDGKLAGITGTLTEIRSKQRVVIELESLHAGLVVEVCMGDVEEVKINNNNSK